MTIEADERLKHLHDLCRETNKHWKTWFHLLPGELKDEAYIKYQEALKQERMLYDVVMQEGGM